MTLDELTNVQWGIARLREGDDITEAVRVRAHEMLECFNRMGCMPPRISCHGPNSLVFTWDEGVNSFYVTVSDGGLSFLQSDPEHISLRADFVRSVPTAEAKP